MHILVVGLSHNSAPIGVRERLALPPAVRARLVAQLGISGVAESVMLVTHERTELYVAGPEPIDAGLLFDALAAASSEDRPAFEPWCYQRTGHAAVQHLLRVATGLDTMILGDPTVAGHVSGAYDHSVEAGTAGTALGIVFQAAIRAAQRARAETHISEGAEPLPGVAAQLVSRALEDVSKARVVLLGAGAAAGLAAESLRSLCDPEIVVLNRTRSRAEKLAQTAGASSEALHKLPELVVGSHALIACVATPQPLVSEAMILRAALTPRQRPYVIADLSVPRSVHHDASRLPGVQYMDADVLGTLARATANGRSAAIPAVEAIITDECTRVAEKLPDAAEARILTSREAPRIARPQVVE